ncbi:MAG: cysteine--tRNA ligase [Candidatus Omnitrophota bacterium]|nr:cysteine--tRNA ligase [Candidatus Omnitrophota bacterium]
MALYIYNSLTKRKEAIPPAKEQKTIKMYSCGVTAYDRCHIGHARSLYVFDVIRRYLKFSGYNMNFVRNITDIDDKIINRANELKKRFEVVVKENIDAYYQDLEALGIAKADIEPRATENIPEMVAHIEALIKKDYAYEIGGDVYFSVRQFKNYGKLSHQSIDQMKEATRIDADPRKKDPLDFALWKKSKDGEPSWKSPWGQGRPGWHIECSCMSMKFLKTHTLDIHAGGRDLIFPHHENEIAQSEALTGKPFAKHWIHHGLLTINGQKMAKSLGNFITVQDVLKKYPVDTLKMFFLASHYASPIDYSEEKIQEAGKALQKFDILFWKAAGLIQDETIEGCNADFIERAEMSFTKAMDDDFNTPEALAALFELINDTNKFIDEEKKDPRYQEIIFQAVETLETFCREVFGLFTKEPQKELPPATKELLDQRVQARISKDFKRSDEIRALLQAQGVVVEDTKEGQTWRWA